MVGVGVGTGALGSVIGKLAALLGDEYKMLKRVRKDIAFLERELRRMQILVNVLADMEELDALAKDWKGSMRDLSYDMEECIDRFMLRIGDGDAKRSFPKEAARRLKTLFARHGIGTQIKELKARVAEEGERRQRLNLDNYAPAKNVAIDPRLAAFHGVAKGLVAMDRRRDEVVSLLTEESVELKVVSIVGGGGLGKTTLAMETYRKIGEHFACRASVSVSRTPDLEMLLKDVLSQIDGDAQSERWKKDQLIRRIQSILTGKRYFLVIDDVWKIQDWKFLKAAFPDSNNGSRIIATTRITKVAKSCCSNSGDQLYQMPPLNDVDSRRLFFKRIFNSENSCPTQLKDVSARILRKCGGVPLAINTIASLLSHKTQTPDEWERLQDSIGAGLSYETDGLVMVLAWASSIFQALRNSRSKLIVLVQFQRRWRPWRVALKKQSPCIPTVRLFNSIFVENMKILCSRTRRKGSMSKSSKLLCVFLRRIPLKKQSPACVSNGKGGNEEGKAICHVGARRPGDLTYTFVSLLPFTTARQLVSGILILDTLYLE